MTATSIFIRINVWLKFIIHSSTIASYIIINSPPATMLETLTDFLQTQGNNWSLLDHKQELSHLFYIVMIAVILHLIDRQVEYILSLNIQWNEQLESDRVESQTVGQINRILLENILPPHVLKRYLYNTTVSYDQLYHESVSNLAYKTTTTTELLLMPTLRLLERIEFDLPAIQPLGAIKRREFSQFGCLKTMKG